MYYSVILVKFLRPFVKQVVLHENSEDVDTNAGKLREICRGRASETTAAYQLSDTRSGCRLLNLASTLI